MDKLLIAFLLMVSLPALASATHASERRANPGPLALRSIASEASGTTLIHSKVYEMGSDRKVLLFNMLREERVEGPRTTIVETFTDPQGIEALKAVTVIQDGKFSTYEMKQLQTHETARIEARDGKIYFELVDERTGKTKKDDEKWRDDFVIGATLSRHIRAHWAELVAGKDVEMRFGVPERLETVGFKVFKSGEKQMDGHDVLVLEFKPTSMFIAALVKPLYFYFDKNSQNIVSFVGRTLPKKKVGDSWKDLDAESVYSD